MKKKKSTIGVVFLVLMITFSVAHADIDFDVSDLFSLNTAFNEHRHSAISDLFSLNTTIDEHHHSAMSGFFSLNTAFSEHYYSALSDLFNLNTAFQPDDRITLIMDEGWNMISINISPDEAFWEEDEDRGPNVVSMLEQLRIDEDNHHVILIKNVAGQFYSPAWGFSSIPFWNILDGYLIKVDEALETTWFGEPMQSDADIPINEGWNMIGFLPTYELDASSPDFYVLSPIIDNVILAKDIAGRFISPEHRYSNMVPWRETQGYQVKLDADATLNYPDEQERIAAVYADLENKPQVSPHWSSPIATGENMSVLISAIKGHNISEDDQIVALSDDGRVVGLSTFSDGRCGMAVWGDDASTDEIEGMQFGEVFELRYWDSVRKIESSLTISDILEGAGLVYETDAFTVLDLAMHNGIPDEYFLGSAYPNPFNSIIRLNYGLPETARLTIKVYDVSGRLVTTLINDDQPAGYHTALWKGDNVSSGSYFVKMKSENFNTVQKIALVK